MSYLLDNKLEKKAIAPILAALAPVVGKIGAGIAAKGGLAAAAKAIGGKAIGALGSNAMGNALTGASLASGLTRKKPQPQPQPQQDQGMQQAAGLVEQTWEKIAKVYKYIPQKDAIKAGLAGAGVGAATALGTTLLKNKFKKKNEDDQEEKSAAFDASKLTGMLGKVKNVVNKDTASNLVDKAKNIVNKDGLGKAVDAVKNIGGKAIGSVGNASGLAMGATGAALGAGASLLANHRDKKKQEEENKVAKSIELILEKSAYLNL